MTINTTDSQFHSPEDISELERLRARVAELETALAKTPHAEEATLDSRLLSLILNNLSDGVMVANMDRQIILANPMAIHLFKPVEEFDPQDWSQAFGVYAGDGLTPLQPESLPLMRALDGERTTDQHLVIRHPDAPEGHRLSVSAWPLIDDAGVKQGGVLVCHDITAQYHAEETARIWHEMVTNMLTGIVVLSLEKPGDKYSLQLVAANPAANNFVGKQITSMIGQRFLDIFPSSANNGRMEVYVDLAENGGVRELGETEYISDAGTQSLFQVRAFGLPGNRVCIVFEDVTERKENEARLRRSQLQEEIIQAQNAALAELSTPLIPITEDVVVMPIIGTVDSRRAQQVMETLLNGISENNARVAILDITGVSVVDTQVANVFIGAAQAVKLLGSQVMLTGIRPEVAQTLIGLGVDLAGIITHSSLQRGIAQALRTA